MASQAEGGASADGGDRIDNACVYTNEFRAEVGSCFDQRSASSRFEALNEIREHMRASDHGILFVLGCFERPATSRRPSAFAR